jgi:hypothetical protein
MAKLPEPIHATANMIYAAYEEDAENGNRPHLGASLIGHACERFLWLTFRWVDAKKFEGRMLRLFETGQLAEERMAKNLRRIGVELHTETPDGKQWKVEDLGKHFGGSMDGAGKGFPEGPKTWAVWECKTSNTKGFRELQKNGVQKAKPLHYSQMMTYCGYTSMDRAMYTCICKETDEIYTEWVHFDMNEFAKLKARAERVVFSNEPPLKINNDPSWFTCKMCDFHAHCHGEMAPAVNCRTCAHSTAEPDGDARWSCAHHKFDLTLEVQREGCTNHRYIPILLDNFATMTDFVDGDVVYTTKATGQTFANGERLTSLDSQEIRDLENKLLLGDVAKLKLDLQAQGVSGTVVK